MAGRYSAAVIWSQRPLIFLDVGQACIGRPVRSFVWIDDEITDADRARVSAHHRGRALLHRVDPGQGITDADFDILDEWLRSEIEPASGNSP